MKRCKVFLFLAFICFFSEARSQSFSSVTDEKDCFPMWVFNSKNYVGVSDAIILQHTDVSTIEQARKQAVQRALYLYSLDRSTLYITFNNILYEKNIDDVMGYKTELLVDSIKFSTTLSNFSYKILDEYISPSGELFVHIAVKHNTSLLKNIDFETCLIAKIYEDPVPVNTLRDYRYQLKVRDNFLENDHEWIIESVDTKSYLETTLWYSNSIVRENIYSIYDVSTYGIDNLKCENGRYFAIKGTYWYSFFEDFVTHLSAFVSSDFSVETMETLYNDNIIESMRRLKYSLFLQFDYHLKGVKNNKLDIIWRFNKVEK